MPVIAGDGNKVTVFRFAMYDIRSDTFEISKRWATETFIAEIGARRVGPGVDAEPSEVEDDGRTKPDFDPNPRTSGFQLEVRSDFRR